jgi:LEA14-like dessication related protein
MALAVSLVLSGGCETLQRRDPLQVTVAGIEPLQGQGQGLELRLLVKLRVQNPNDAPVDYNGVSVDMNVQGKSFATGVSDAHGSVPRFGDAVISVPVTVSAFRMMGQALGMMRHGAPDKITYEMKGKLHRSSFSSTHFQTQGELELPTTANDDN